MAEKNPYRRPEAKDYPSYYEQYIAKIEGDHLLSALQDNAGDFIELLAQVPEEQTDYAYKKGKWTINQLIQHIIDTERIMLYRALSFARNETQNLAGFDENAYADVAKSSHLSVSALQAEFLVSRQSTLAFFRNTRYSKLNNRGVANGNEMSVRSLGWIIAGHTQHHMEVLAERYLKIKKEEKK